LCRVLKDADIHLSLPANLRPGVHSKEAFVRHRGGLYQLFGDVKFSCHCRESNYDSPVVQPFNLDNVPDKLRQDYLGGNIRCHSHQNLPFPNLMSESMRVKVHRGTVLLFRGMKLGLHDLRKGTK